MAGGGSSFSSQLPQTHGSLEPQPPVLSASESQGFRWRSCSRWQWLQTSSPRLPKAEPRPPGPKRPRIASEQKRPDRRRGTGTYKSPRGFRQAGEESDPGEQTWRRQLREVRSFCCGPVFPLQDLGSATVPGKTQGEHRLLPLPLVTGLRRRRIPRTPIVLSSGLPGSIFSISISIVVYLGPCEFACISCGNSICLDACS